MIKPPSPRQMDRMLDTMIATGDPIGAMDRFFAAARARDEAIRATPAFQQAEAERAARLADLRAKSDARLAKRRTSW